MEDYLRKFSSLQEKLKKKKRNSYSSETLTQILQEEFEISVTRYAPHDIYGNWKENQVFYTSLSHSYFKPKQENPLNSIIPQDELMLSRWTHIVPFLQRHHHELLWFVEKERFLIAENQNIKLNQAEKEFKEKAEKALRKNDRIRAFDLLKKIIAHSPDDFSLYVDMGFLLLNDKHNPEGAIKHFEGGCKAALLHQINSDLYCFLMLQINMIQQIMDNSSAAFKTTRELMRDFKNCNEVNYQHGINLINTDKEKEGFSCLSIVCRKNINYALKIYREIKAKDYSEALSEIFQQIVENREDKFYTLNQRKKAAFEEARRLKIEDWVPTVIPSLEPDLDIINTLGNSAVYVNIVAAEYFSYKTPELLISKITEDLQKKAKSLTRKNRRLITNIREELDKKLMGWEKYNRRGIVILVITTAILFALSSYYQGILYGLFASLIFASVLLMIMGINFWQMHRLKDSTKKEIQDLEAQALETINKYKEKADKFAEGIRTAVEI